MFLEVIGRGFEEGWSWIVLCVEMKCFFNCILVGFGCIGSICECGFSVN